MLLRRGGQASRTFHQMLNGCAVPGQSRPERSRKCTQRRFCTWSLCFARTARSSTFAHRCEKLEPLGVAGRSWVPPAAPVTPAPSAPVARAPNPQILAHFHFLVDGQHILSQVPTAVAAGSMPTTNGQTRQECIGGPEGLRARVWIADSSSRWPLAGPGSLPQRPLRPHQRP